VATKAEIIDVSGRDVRVSNPDKVYFPASGKTKMDLVQYYLSVMPGALRGGFARPTSLYRWPNGVEAPDDAFFQKRVPDKGRPEWLTTATVSFPSGRKAEMLALSDPAHIIWAVNLGCIDFNPWPVRAGIEVPDSSLEMLGRGEWHPEDGSLDYPDELRIDLDPTPDIPWDDVRKTALMVRDVLGENDLVGWPKTSGKRGIHIYVRIHPERGFTEVRRAALALAREVERRSDGMATTAWWKEERVGVFLDFNQNARDRTIASAYSVRPVSAGTVSCPLAWDEVPDVETKDLDMDSVPKRFAKIGDPHEGIDDAAGSLDPLLDLARKDEEGGIGDAPWPPHFPKMKDEPKRVQPSKAKKT
jgi:bifunctional non-homologous end joining protein LigD